MYCLHIHMDVVTEVSKSPKLNSTLQVYTFIRILSLKPLKLNSASQLYIVYNSSFLQISTVWIKYN